jgi:hypothetical protein
MRYIFVLLLVISHAVMAHQPTIDECLEGAEFIGNAALLRDSGLPQGTESEFMSKALEDLEAIKQYPAELRWFVQDQQDADFLISEILLVFQNPQQPRAHYHDFFNRCTQR